MRASRRDRRRQRDDYAVLGFLHFGGPAYPLEVWDSMAIPSGRIYSALRRLERDGLVVSRGVHGAHKNQQRREYRIADAWLKPEAP